MAAHPTPSGQTAYDLVPIPRGSFDGLSALYAAINAMRLVSRNDPAIDDEIWDGVFGVLVEHTTEQVGLDVAIASGIKPKALRSILRAAADELEDSYALTYRVGSPFPKTIDVRVDPVAELEWCLQDRDCAVMARATPDRASWTVVRELQPDCIRLFEATKEGVLLGRRVSAKRIVVIWRAT